MSLRHFDVGAVLGQGAVGTVYAGVHRPSGTTVAIKTLTTQSRAAEISLNRELTAMARLHHLRVLYLYDHGVAGPDDPFDEGTAWLALEYASGGSLQEWLPSTWLEARAAMLAVLDGLAHAHARGLVHRDLKPENLIRCTPDDLRPGLKIADFGLAWATDRDRRGIRRGGTPAYISPEQVRGSVFELGPWTDLYAFGAMAWEWVTGEPPFGWVSVEEQLEAHQHSRVPDLKPRLPVPDGLEEMLRHLLAKSVASRPAAAAWVASRLLDLGEPAGVVSSVPHLEPTRSLSTLFVEPEPSEFTRPTAPPTERLPVPRSWHANEPAYSSVLAGVGMGLIRLRDLRVVGRTTERDALWAALRSVAREKRPTVLALTGPENMGTSRLARWLVERSRELGTAEGYLAEPEQGLAGLVDRAFNLVANRGELDVPDTLTTLEQGVVENRASPSPQMVFEWLVERAIRGPIVIRIDDAASSPELSELLTTALFWEGEAPLLFVATGRTGEGLWDELGYLPRFSKRALEPLDETSMMDLAKADLGLHQSLAVRMAADCGGQPGLLVSWVRVLADRGLLVSTPDGFELAEGERLVRPGEDDLRDRVLGAMAELSPTEQTAVGVGAVLGDRVDLDEWKAVRRVLGLRIRESILRPLVRAGLVTRGVEHWQFDDPRTRFVLLQRLELQDELSGLQVAVAAGLARMPESPQRQARRGELLLEAGHDAHGRRLLQTALDGLLAARDWRSILRITERLREGIDLDAADLDTRFAILFHGTNATRLLDSSAAAVADAERALPMVEALDPERGTKLLQMIAEVFVIAKDPRADLVLARVEADDSRMQRLRAMRAMETGDLQEAERVFLAAFDTAPDPHTKGIAANGLGMLMGGQERLEEAAHWFQTCAGLVEERQAFVPIANETLVRVRQREFEKATALARRALELTEKAEGVRVRSAMMLTAALAAIGNRDQALLRHVRERAMYSLRTYGVDYAHPIARCIEVLDEVADTEGRAFLDAVRGRIESARR